MIRKYHWFGFISIILLHLISNCRISAQTLIPDGSIAPVATGNPVLPHSYYPGAPVNYVRIVEPLVPMNGINQGAYPAGNTIKHVINYFDGLARPVQSIDVQASPEGNDMVMYKLYDEFGREQIQYLPYSSPTRAGDFKTNSQLEQKDYYQNISQIQPGFAGETSFYSNSFYEANPLSRVLKVTVPGNSWAGSEKGIQYKYTYNTLDEEVRKWTIEDTHESIPQTNTTYLAGELYKNVVFDEHQKKTIEYKDVFGQVVLKKVQIDDNPEIGHKGWLCTYYVYDDFGLLRFVIQPKAVDLIIGNGGLDWNLDGFVNGLCFIYEYDQRNRMIYKKVPDADPVFMVYDSRDRLILTQDGNMRMGDKWLYTRYDALNRPSFIGILKTTNDWQALMNIASTAVEFPDVNASYDEKLKEFLYDEGADQLHDGGISLLTANGAPYHDPVEATKLYHGKLSKTKVRVLNTDDWVTYTTIFDNKSRPIQTSEHWGMRSHHRTNMYDFRGLVLSSVEAHSSPDGVSVYYHIVLSKFKYDAQGRILECIKQVDQDGIDHLIFRNSYNEQGQLAMKKLGTVYGGAIGEHLEQLTYDYNVRGWLRSINGDYASGTNNGNWFGQLLYYDYGFTDKQLNGNISGLQWRSRGDGEKRAYGFNYDNANRLLIADFSQFTNNGWNKQAGIDFSVYLGEGDYKKAYDANGNILSMLQKGLQLNISKKIDDMRYTYVPKSNKLLNVIDFANDMRTKLGDFHYTNNHPFIIDKQSYAINPGNPNIDIQAVTDYTYDKNGNMVRDYNKDIGYEPTNEDGIEYNHLNLPSVITVRKDNGGGIKGTITYLYDADGNKLSKIVVEDDKRTETTYFGGVVFENKRNLSEPPAADVVQFIQHEEGRIRRGKEINPDQSVTEKWLYDFFVKDHLGNVRVVLTEQRNHAKYMATFEQDREQLETVLFDNITSTGINIAGISNYPTDNTYTPNARTSMLDGKDKKIGATKTLKVMSGDQVSISAKYWFPNALEANQSNTIPQNMLEGLIQLLSSGAGSVSGGKLDPGDLIGTNGILAPGINQFLNDYPNPQGSTVRKAYVNWILFDEQLKYVPEGSGFRKIEDGYDANIRTLGPAGITIPKNGYLFVFLSNETQINSGGQMQYQKVYFDNLLIEHQSSPLVEETHYYPFGLTMQGISSKAAQSGAPNNKFKYNGYEENSDFDLNLYETFYRSHDPQLGRFWQVDPKIEAAEAWSPYSAMLNNPILYNDPLGDIVRNGHDEEVRLATDRRDAARADLDASMAANGVDENVSKKDFLSAGHTKAEWKAFKNTRNAFNRAENRLNTALSNQFEAQEDINELAHNNPTLFNAVNNLPIDVFIGRTNDSRVTFDAGGGANLYNVDGAGTVQGRMINLDEFFGGVAQWRPGMAVWIQTGRGQYTTVMHEVGHTASMYGGVPAIGVGGIPYGTPGNPANVVDYVRNFADGWGGGCGDCRSGRGCNPTSAAAVAAERLPLEAAARYVRAANPFRRR